MDQPIERLRLNACKCRELASTAITPAAREVLSDLAEQYDEKAATLVNRRGASRRPAFAWPVT